MIDDITALDFETNALTPGKGRVIEIGAVRCIKGVVTSTFQTLVKFEGRLSPKVTAITGIKATDLEQGMDERTAFAILKNLIGDSILVAHNAPFDLGYLHFAYLRLSRQTVLKNSFLDTLSICRLRHSSPRGLLDMCRVYGIDHLRPHRALPDAMATLALAQKLHAESPVGGLLNKVVVNPKYGRPQWLPFNAEIIYPTSMA